jgi:hypothetical protein
MFRIKLKLMVEQWAKELGETEESMGSIAVVIVGVIIVAIVPPLASILFNDNNGDTTH